MPPGPSRVKIIIPDVPEATRAAVEAYAEEHDLSRNQVAVEILERKYRLPRSTPTSGGYRAQENGGREGPWSLEVPVGVRSALRVDAAQKGATISGIVRAALAKKFGLPVEATTRKPRRRRGDN